MWYLPIMEKLLTEEDARQLRAIWRPTVVAIQPEDSRRSICVMPDGELRCYGYADKPSPYAYREGTLIYLSSRDCGLSWKKHFAPSNDVMGPAARSPWSGDYVTVIDVRKGEDRGTWALRSALGPDDPAPERVKMSDEVYGDMFQPKALLSRGRWIVSMHLIKDGNYIPTVALSDDDGKSWRLVHLKSTPKHEPVWPHVDVRWQNNGAEPIVTEMQDGRLMLLARTSLDFLYVYYSEDGGESWTDGEPSQFHCTLTTPYLLEMSDGRTVLFWNNTQPLPEVNHSNIWPAPEQAILSGWGEDAFTNRDANHAAVSNDCINWEGFRELFLNEIRNEPDFRLKGGVFSSGDKSVHQFQALELPFNKILVAFGQHEISRRIVIFDIGWLYEKTRIEDFQRGLENLSTQMYVKSISGNHYGTGFGGHCAWNRTDGALLVPDPDATYGEALQICRVKDERLFSEIQGAVWNFPMAHTGELKLQIRISGAGIRVTLCDHWFNPTDVTARELSPFSFTLTCDMLPADVWQEVTVRFDTAAGLAEVLCGEKRLFKVKMRQDAPIGLSYLHMQTLAEGYDAKGTYIRRMEMEAL